MYILYLDEAGTHGEASYFILAGLAVFKREIYCFGQDLDQLQAKFFPEETKPVFFHAARLNVTPSQNIEEPWNKLTKEQRRELKSEVYEIIKNRKGILFGCAIEKRFAELREENPYERSFEELLGRFDLFLIRLNRLASAEGSQEQRGLIFLAESSYEKTIAILARRLQGGGTRWRSIHNITDVPFFAPAKDTRLLQYADFVSNAIYGRYHAGLTRDFDSIGTKFDQEGNMIHGLVHLSMNSECSCIACFSRRGR